VQEQLCLSPCPGLSSPRILRQFCALQFNKSLYSYFISYLLLVLPALYFV
jgi:hypothetical protein